MHIRVIRLVGAGTLAVYAAACTAPKAAARASEPNLSAGTVYVVKDTSIRATFAASGTAQPIQQATLSTKLMGTVTDVSVKEGDAVDAGQALIQIDARDLAAKRAQVSASIADAEAMHRDALVQAGRMRALYADSAATRAQLDAAETGLARAEAGVRAANAAASELSAMTSYSIVRAPFAGVVIKRFVDPGAFAVPGGPLLAVQDGRQLRISASATPDAVRALRRGQPIAAQVEGRSVAATIEGVVPAAAGNLYTINAIVANSSGALLPGSTATLLLPRGARSAIVVPAAAIVRQGDLTGVTLRTAAGDEVRWVRLGTPAGAVIEVTAGLKAGDRIVVPAANGTSATAAGN